MSPEEQHLADRAEQAAKVIASAGLYKVCEGCESVVTSDSAICSQCHGYRFDPNSKRVIAQAKHLAVTPQQGVSPEDLY